MPPKSRRFVRLTRAVDYSRQRLEVYRRNRYEALQQYVGHNYSEDGSRRRVPVNFLELAVNIYKRNLVAQNPKVLVTTVHTELLPQALEFEVVINKLLREIDFSASLDEYVTDAIFSLAVMKVGVTSGDMAEDAGFFHDAGQPFADRVDLDDWVHDMTARRYEEIQYAGNRWRATVQGIADSEMFRASMDEILAHQTRMQFNEQGDERTGLLGRGQTGEFEEWERTVELWDLWVPRGTSSREPLVVTFLADDRGALVEEKPVNIVEWEGPEEGPYYPLGFGTVPNNTMPLSPVSLMMDLHELSNVLFNKLGRQAQRQKTITGVQGGADADGNRILRSEDGEMIRLDNPSNTKEFNFGGIDQTNLVFFLQVRDLFYQLNGNLDLLGGLSPQSRTLGQDELLQDNASERLVEMRNQTTKVVRKIVTTLAKYRWYDPLSDITEVKRIPGSDIELPFRFSPELQEGDFVDYNFDISPFSMVDNSPGQKLRSMANIFDRFIAPYIAQMEQSGVGIDFNQLMRTVAKYSDLPELEQILTLTTPNPRQPDSGGGSGRARQAPNTTRTVNRVNTPGGSRRAGDANITQALQSLNGVGNNNQ